MELRQLLQLIYDMGKSDGIEIGREQVLNENLIRLEKQLANVEVDTHKDMTNGYILLSKE